MALKSTFVPLPGDIDCAWMRSFGIKTIVIFCLLVVQYWALNCIVSWMFSKELQFWLHCLEVAWPWMTNWEKKRVPVIICIYSICFLGTFFFSWINSLCLIDQSWNHATIVSIKMFGILHVSISYLAFVEWAECLQSTLNNCVYEKMFGPSNGFPSQKCEIWVYPSK